MAADENVFRVIATRLGGTLAGHTPLAGGVSARVEAVDIALGDGSTRRVVFREPNAAEWKAGQPGADASARRELDLLGWLHARGLPVPRPLLIDTSGEVHPRPWFVMEHVDGGREPVPPTAPAQMADVLAAIHTLDPAGAPALPEREDPVVGLVELLPEGSSLRARLSNTPPSLTPRRALLHGDYWPGNVLWRDGALVAVLDWEDAALGDPLSDVACCRLELRYKHGPDATAAFTARYAERAGADIHELPVWDAYVSAAALAYMGQWGLPAEVEARMRREATAFHADATARIPP